MTYKNGNYIKNANNAKAYLFKSSEIEVEADYSYLFNKSYRVLKSMNYQIEEVNRHEGTLEACNIHLGGIDEASRLKIKLEEVEKLKKIYKVKIEFMNKVTLPQSSKITNRFLNLLISKTKEEDKKVERKIDITTDEMD